MAKLRTDARKLKGLVANFARATPGVSHARAGHCRSARVGARRLAVDLTLLRVAHRCTVDSLFGAGET